MLGFGAIGEAAIGALPDRLLNEICDGANIAALTVSGLIIPEREDTQGILVKSYADVWLEIARRLGTDWSLAFQLTPRNWEEMIAGAFDRDGFHVTLTPPTGDHGRDIIAVKGGIGSMRILGSMKAYSPGHLVTREHVHEMLGVVSADLGATKGIIATTSDFAPKVLSDPGLSLAVPFRLELMNGTQLQAWLKDLLDNRKP